MIARLHTRTHAACTARVGALRFVSERGGKEAKVLGFVDGTHGLFNGEAKDISEAEIAEYINTGGMQLLGRTADVVRGEEHLEQAEAACAKLQVGPQYATTCSRMLQYVTACAKLQVGGGARFGTAPMPGPALRRAPHDSHIVGAPVY